MTIQNGVNLLRLCLSDTNITEICLSPCSQIGNDIVVPVDVQVICNDLVSLSFDIKCIDLGWFDYQFKNDTGIVQSGQIYSNG